MLMGKKTIGTVAYMGGLMSVPESFCFALAQMIQYSTEYACRPGEIIHLDRSITSYHAWARNGLVENFLGDWLLMLDTDHVFEPDLLARMLAVFQQYELDVLTGLYHYKVPPHLPVLYRWKTEENAYRTIVGWEKEAPLVEVDCAGAGCLLIRRRVFDRLREELHERPFDPEGQFSEDFSFFNRLRKLGIKSYCCPDIESYHLLAVPISRTHCRPNVLNTETVTATRPMCGTSTPKPEGLLL